MQFGKGGGGAKAPPLSFSNKMARPIYYMTAEVTIIKNKRPQTKIVWIVSDYKTPKDIMNKDKKTMSRLERELFTAKSKNKTFIIDSISTIKQVGTTSNPDERE